MARSVALLVILLGVTNGNGQQPLIPIKLTLSPSPATTRSLQYRLFPAANDLTPGNAASLYLRSLSLVLDNEEIRKELRSDRWEQWQHATKQDWPKDDVRSLLTRSKNVVLELEYAADCRDCDWQISNRKEGLGVLLPDMQYLRLLGSLLAVKARQQIFEGQFTDAARTLQIGFALARNLSKGPTLMHVLAGCAVAKAMIDQVEEWMQAPGSPNLYWSISVLPHPFIDPLHAFTEERNVIENMLPWSKKIDDRIWTKDEVKSAQVGIQKNHDEFGLMKYDGEMEAAKQRIFADYTAEAKKWLKSQGVSDERIKAMPDFQSTMSYILHECRAASEELFKWAHIPESFNHPAYHKAVEQYNKAFVRLDTIVFHGLLKGLARGSGEGLAPGMPMVFTITHQLETRFTALRTIEAIRLYAGTKGGKLPANLSDITLVPIPNQPTTCKPLVYTLKDASATLQSLPPEGEKATMKNSLFYELRLR